MSLDALSFLSLRMLQRSREKTCPTPKVYLITFLAKSLYLKDPARHARPGRGRFHDRDDADVGRGQIRQDHVLRADADRHDPSGRGLHRHGLRMQ